MDQLVLFVSDPLVQQLGGAVLAGWFLKGGVGLVRRAFTKDTEITKRLNGPSPLKSGIVEPELPWMFHPPEEK